MCIIDTLHEDIVGLTGYNGRLGKGEIGTNDLNVSLGLESEMDIILFNKGSQISLEKFLSDHLL